MEKTILSGSSFLFVKGVNNELLERIYHILQNLAAKCDFMPNATLFIYRLRSPVNFISDTGEHSLRVNIAE